MPYPALPDHRIPYDNDGTLVYYGTSSAGAVTLASGPILLAWQDEALTDAGPSYDSRTKGASRVFLFFPEQREITGCFIRSNAGGAAAMASSLAGSNDTTNGQDGTWETASLPSGYPTISAGDFSWREGIKPVSFTGPKKNLRFQNDAGGSSGNAEWNTIHFYGETAAGQMAHDLIYLDPDLGAGVAFPAPEDFGDQPLGTTVVRPFRLKNTSATRTATNINIQCNDADFAISDSGSGGPWVVTINIPSLGPGVESSTMHIRCTTPAPGAALKPRFARIVTVCDAGFFG